MELHQLEYFLAIRDHGSVSTAAAACGVAQPTISQALKALEKELGAELFHRTDRGMLPTSAGHALVGPTRRILRALAAARAEVAAECAAVRGRLEIAAFSALFTGMLPALVASYRRQHPEVVIRIIDFCDEDSGLALIRDGHADLILTHLPLEDSAHRLSGEAELVTLPLATQEFWIAYPPGTPLASSDPMPWSALPNVPLVVVPRGSWHAGDIERAVGRAGRLRPPAAVIAHREARLPFVLNHVGGTFLERSVAAKARRDGAVVRSFDPPLRRTYGLLFDNRSLSSAAQAFVDIARLALAERSGTERI